MSKGRKERSVKVRGGIPSNHEIRTVDEDNVADVARRSGKPEVELRAIYETYKEQERPLIVHYAVLQP